MKKLAVVLLFVLLPVRVKAETTDGERLMRIAMAEAEGEDIEGKAAVMRVVLNRVADERFPGTVEEVLFQKGQFSTVKEGGRYWRLEPDEGCSEALLLIESGWDGVEGALYFTNGTFNKELVYEHGGHRFYR